MRSLPIGPEEAFILSRIDGVTNESDIVASTGLDESRVRAGLTRLAALGAIRFDTVREQASSGPSSAPPPERRSSRHMRRVAVEAIEQPPPPIVEAPLAPAERQLFDPAELDENVEIELDRKRKILETFYQLEHLSHYELLGIPRDAGKRVIKQAYFDVINLYHPDRYFGKKLGSFKPKLERVFARLTEAYDVLTRSGPRADYDQYLESLLRTRELDRVISDSAEIAAMVEQVKAQIEQAARAAEEPGVPLPPATTSRSGEQPRVEAPSYRAPDPEVRRRALARKLRPPSITPTRSSRPPPLVDQGARRERVSADLKRRYEDQLAHARAQQLARYIAAAEQALAEKKSASAANALKIALSLSPDDVTLQHRLEQVERQALVELADSYVSQGEYEARTGRPLEAARSFERAAAGKPSAKLLARAANCTLEGAGDLRHAVELARRAVALAPEDPAGRLLLGRIYFAAGLKASGLAELERGALLAPKDATITDWLKRAKRGDL
jgi:curved DNA-binding protein CbpA